jgi:hypothetical protein
MEYSVKGEQGNSPGKQMLKGSCAAATHELATRAATMALQAFSRFMREVECRPDSI